MELFLINFDKILIKKPANMNISNIKIRLIEGVKCNWSEIG